MRPRLCRNWVRLGDNMPLTEQEREWLERREKDGKEYGSLYCRHCEQFIPECAESIGHCYDDLYCPLTDHFFPDAAEFESRVAVLLAKPRKELRPKGCSWYETTEGGHLVRKTACPPHHDIDNCPGVAMCSLYHARLAVEAEMDK